MFFTSERINFVLKAITISVLINFLMGFYFYFNILNLKKEVNLLKEKVISLEYKNYE